MSGYTTGETLWKGQEEEEARSSPALQLSPPNGQGITKQSCNLQKSPDVTWVLPSDLLQPRGSQTLASSPILTDPTDSR